MNRDHMIQGLPLTPQWDICIIGGGATGLGIAVDAASRGYKTILLEKYDFAKGTSSRSTKLVHGGVRYLQQGNIKLVMEALKERGLLMKNAPHLVKNQSFIVPHYKWWEGPFYGMGLKVYDWMAGSLGLGPSTFLGRAETLALAPTLDPEGLRGSILYHDGQFDDARLAIHLAMTAAEQGATVINYMQVEQLLKENKKVCGVAVKDNISGKEYEVKAKAVINATGVFTDSITRMDEQDAPSLLSISQGIHLVFEKEFLPTDTAIMIPRTDDKRVLFAVPWHDKIIAGTTDTPLDRSSDEPIAFKEEIDFVLNHISHYLTRDPIYTDIKSVFAGLRPLVKGSTKVTAALARDHLVSISPSELITITGGKWTTYRKMASDVVDVAMLKGNLPQKDCVTHELKIHGYKTGTDFSKHLYYYGTDAENIEALIESNASLKEKIHRSLSYTRAEIVWAVKNEMCMCVEDALSRRTRALFLDARAAIESAPVVASIMAAELKKDKDWEMNQINIFNAMAINYLPQP